MKKSGFTLIELLVVIAIIGLLASIVMVNVNNARKKARAAKRASELHQIMVALELYYDDYGYYPNPGWAWRSECNCWGGYSASNVIPGLVPTYMGVFPTDPSMDKSGCRSCYLYLSNGTDYKVLDHNIAEFSAADYLAQRSLVDPARDGGPDGCAADGSNPWSWAIYSSGGKCW